MVSRPHLTRAETSRWRTWASARPTLHHDPRVLGTGWPPKPAVGEFDSPTRGDGWAASLVQSGVVQGCSVSRPAVMILFGVTGSIGGSEPPDRGSNPCGGTCGSWVAPSASGGAVRPLMREAEKRDWPMRALSIKVMHRTLNPGNGVQYPDGLRRVPEASSGEETTAIMIWITEGTAGGLSLRASRGAPSFHPCPTERV